MFVCVCVLHDLFLALAPARCVSVSLHRLLLPCSACDCLRRRKLTSVHDVCKRKKTSVMPGDEVVENRSCLWFLRTGTQALDPFFSKKIHVKEKMARVLDIYVEKALRREPSSDGRKGNPHEKLHIRLREMFGCPLQLSTSKALFETQERREFCMEPPCGHLSPSCGCRGLSRSFICIQIFLASDLFFF